MFEYLIFFFDLGGFFWKTLTAWTTASSRCFWRMAGHLTVTLPRKSS